MTVLSRPMPSDAEPAHEAGSAMKPAPRTGILRRLSGWHRRVPWPAGEMLPRSWMDNAAPLLILIVIVAVIASLTNGFFGPVNLTNTTRQLGEYGLLAIAMMIVIVGGGIDLSIGSNFALANVLGLALLNVAGFPLWLTIPCVMLVSGAVGLFNGLLVGYLRLRAFLTTLVTLILVRAIVDMILLHYAVKISGTGYFSDAWDFLGDGKVLGLPFSAVLLLVVAILVHLGLTRFRPGWNIMAVGGSRRAAHNAGIPTQWTVCSTYIASGFLCGASGVLYAARLNSAGSDTGIGLEVSVLTAVVLGGNALGGGRGSVAKALIGAATILILTNGVVRLGMASGAATMVLGLVLLLAVTLDVRWLKRRARGASILPIAPVSVSLPVAPSLATDSASPYAINARLAQAEAIGLGHVEGSADIAFDRSGHLYTGGRQGQILRFLAPDFTAAEVFAHIGGHPKGLAFGHDDMLFAAVSGLGLYKVSPQRTVEKVTDMVTDRRLGGVGPIRAAGMLDVAADGRIFLTESSTRRGTQGWLLELLDGRASGRILCHDPARGTTRALLRDLASPNGVCLAHDGHSLLFTESSACRISRLWLEGPDAGRVEPLLQNLPGHPGAVTRAANGCYWISLLAVRSTALDIALRMPRFRRRMVQRISSDEWLQPNSNVGCVLKFDGQGAVLDALWDPQGLTQTMIASAREYGGHLYLAGMTNEQIGRLPVSDPASIRLSSWSGSARRSP